MCRIAAITSRCESTSFCEVVRIMARPISSDFSVSAHYCIVVNTGRAARKFRCHSKSTAFCAVMKTGIRVSYR